MTKEQFVEISMIKIAIEHLHIYSDKTLWPAQQKVREYLKRTDDNLPIDLPISIEFKWEKYGIVVSYKYTKSGFGCLDTHDDNEMSEYRTVKYSYLEIFGWEPTEDWNKPFQLSEVMEVIKGGLKK